MLNSFLHPGLVLIFGAFLTPLLSKRVRSPYAVLLTASALFICLTSSPGHYGSISLFGYEITPLVRVDSLSLLFAYVFCIVGLIGMIYCYHIDDWLQHLAGLMYCGSALGVVFAADILSFYLFWEMLAFSAVLLIWAQRSKQAVKAGYRYIMVHVFSGLMVFAGMMLYITSIGSVEFTNLTRYSNEPFFWLILLGVMLCAAVPPLNAWLPDAYPSATIYGSVFLSAFTTKSAVYALIRAFPGTELLIYFGAIMAIYGVIYATMENNLRRLLSYHIISQVGYMVCGVGLGTAMALDGSSAHAFAHIIYKGLLFMSAGAVIYATGKEKISELGGFYRYSPIVALFFFVGGLSISGLPLTSGFVSKAVTISASAEIHNSFAYLLLNLATTGTFLSIVLKMGYYTFFSEPRTDYRSSPIPANMSIAMAFASALCIVIGCFPGVFYKLLPYPIEYKPYTLQHILDTLGLFAFTGLVFSTFLKKLKPKPVLNLDTDWFYRKVGFVFVRGLNKTVVPAEYNYVGVAYRWLMDRVTIPFGERVSSFEHRVVYPLADLLARRLRILSDVIGIIQNGKIQDYATYMILSLFLVLVAYLIIGG
ncbi:multisubunit sodium/proton antiporter MrpD subunit [Thermodesulfitimonas autotrophica]|uniref:Multisubunit sodium/proton antiporter MrpD subunit n=1 Tax=Thermodesulfitimonas autotrophica TaxID=1894989 RepID=A0A3N5ANY3_9THEO|nr:Na(+)/H(+) antiporter subunit D [Thermodesulfitimonas autotrophica]RPF46916.1 multisubunit sodium/proton antiporter MrpD subunit [Thermodesulfitimonas autotrophica]